MDARRSVFVAMDDLGIHRAAADAFGWHAALRNPFSSHRRSTPSPDGGLGAIDPLLPTDKALALPRRICPVDLDDGTVADERRESAPTTVTTKPGEPCRTSTDEVRPRRGALPRSHARLCDRRVSRHTLRRNPRKGAFSEVDPRIAVVVGDAELGSGSLQRVPTGPKFATGAFKSPRTSKGSRPWIRQAKAKACGRGNDSFSAHRRSPRSADGGLGARDSSGATLAIPLGPHFIAGQNEGSPAMRPRTRSRSTRP